MSGNMKVLVAMLATCLVLGLLVSMAAAAKKKNQEPHYKNGEHNDAAHADDDKLSSADFIKKVIAEHDVVIFSKSYCPFCKRAKQLFTNENIPFHAVELDLHPNGGDIQKALLEKTGQRTVPNIFIKGEHLGGSDAAHDAHQSGRLAKMLQ